MRANTLNIASQKSLQNKNIIVTPTSKKKIVINASRVKSLKLKFNKSSKSKLPLIQDTKSPNRTTYKISGNRSKTPLGLRRDINFNDFSMNINNNYISPLSFNPFSKNDLQIILSLKKELKIKNEENSRLHNEIEEIKKNKTPTAINELEIENKILNDEIQKMKKMCSDIGSKGNFVVENKEKENELQKNIDSLTLQNKKLKEVVSTLNTSIAKAQNELTSKDEEIEKLKNIIEELKKKEEEMKSVIIKEVEKNNSIEKKNEIVEDDMKDEIKDEEDVLEKQIHKYQQLSKTSRSKELHISSSIELSLLSNGFTLPNMISQDEIDKVLFLLIKVHQSSNRLPLSTLTNILPNIHSITDFTNEIVSLFNFDQVTQCVLNRFAYGLGFTNDHFSIDIFKDKLLSIFTKQNVLIEDNIDIYSEFKSNCISDIISTCVNYDTHYNGYIHFDLFTNVILPYVNKETVTKKGYEYLIYTMKKPNEHEEDKNELHFNIFMLNYKNLSMLIPKLSSKNTITNIEQTKEEEEEAIISFVPMSNEENTDNEAIPSSTRNESVDIHLETKGFVNEVFNKVIEIKKNESNNVTSLINEETKKYVQEVFDNVINMKNKDE